MHPRSPCFDIWPYAEELNDKVVLPQGNVQRHRLYCLHRPPDRGPTRMHNQPKGHIMPNQLWLRIEPEKAINSADAESLQVRVSYEISIQTEDKQNDSHPASDIIRLDRHASAESKLEPVLLSKPIHARLESRQGQELADLGEIDTRSEEHTSELQSRPHLVCRLLLEKK